MGFFFVLFCVPVFWLDFGGDGGWYSLFSFGFHFYLDQYLHSEENIPLSSQSWLWKKKNLISSFIHADKSQNKPGNVRVFFSLNIYTHWMVGELLKATTIMEVWNFINYPAKLLNNVINHWSTSWERDVMLYY